MRVLVTTAALMLLIGCQTGAVRKTVVQSAIEYNLGYEQANNKLLLLNIVRAMQHQPKYFTALTSISTSKAQSMGYGPLAIPFGRSTDTAFGLALSANRGLTPAVTQSTLDSKGFTQGLLNPVSGSTIKQLVDQGWPEEFLWLILIDRINVKGKNYYNDPESPAKFADFQQMLRTQMKDQVFGSIGQDVVAVGPPVGVDDVAKVAAQVAYAKDGLTLHCLDSANSKGTTPAPPNPYANCPGKLSLARVRTQYGWGSPPSPPGQPSSSAHKAAFEVFAAVENTDLVEFPGIEKPRDEPKPVPALIRSPEGVISYLGAVARAQRRTAGFYVTYYGQDEGSIQELKLLDVVRVDDTVEDDPDLVQVEYYGAKYRIDPLQDGNRSLRTLALVHLLLGLQKEASELQSPGVFTIIGGSG